MNVKRFAISLVKYGLLAAALVVTAGLSALTTMRVVLRTQEVVVPSLVGRPLPEAGALASQRRLGLRVEGRRNDPKVGRDLIVEQEPAAGRPLKTQRSIRVWVSLGPRRLTVPAVEGESVRSGRLLLEQAQVPLGRVIEVDEANITVSRIVEVDDPAPEGQILVQSPPPGETDPDESAMSLLVSRGPGNRDFVMPDLIGRPALPVLETLRAAGLKVADVRYRTYPGVSPGLVLRQSPLAGYRVSPQTSIGLDVSQGGP